MERRKSVRFQLPVPAVIRWRLNGGAAEQGGGFTRDISSKGIFVHCSSAPPPGIQVTIEVVLPPLQAGLHGLKLRAPGQVVRVEKEGDLCGVAATAHFAIPEALPGEGKTDSSLSAEGQRNGSWNAARTGVVGD